MHVGAKVQRNDNADRLVDCLTGRVSEQALGARIPTRNDAIKRLSHNGVVRRFDGRDEKLFTLGIASQLRFAALALADINDLAEHEQTVWCIYGVQADLALKLSIVFTDPKHVAVRPHAARL